MRNHAENKYPSKFNQIRRSRLGLSVAGLAVTAAALLSVAKFEPPNSTESIVPKDKIVQVEGKTPAPRGFKAKHITPEKALHELQGVNGMENYIVAKDSKGNEGIYQFMIPDPDTGIQHVEWVADSWKQLGELGKDAYHFSNAAEVITTGHDSLDPNQPEQYLMVQADNNKHPVTFKINYVGVGAVAQAASPEIKQLFGPGSETPYK